MAFFISKKQKQQMKERRRRKKKANANMTSKQPEQQQDQEQEASSAPKKGSGQQETMVEKIDTAAEENSQTQPSTINHLPSSDTPTTKSSTSIVVVATKIMDGKLFVLVPPQLSSSPKDTRKFRKDARRVLREKHVQHHGHDQTKQEDGGGGSVGNEDSEQNSTKKRRRRSQEQEQHHDKHIVLVGALSSSSPSRAKQHTRLVTNEMIDGIEFVTVDEMPSMRKLLPSDTNDDTAGNNASSNKRMKTDHHDGNSNGKKFPSIKELLQEKRVRDEQHKQQSKLQSKLDAIPDTVKQQYVAMDCEMVGIGTDGVKSALARVSIVDWHLNVLLDKYVQVPIKVTDFRTHVSGVEPKHIQKRTGAITPDECRKMVSSILKSHEILVGHALSNDLKALLMTHPKAQIRDTAKYRPFQQYRNSKWRPRKLRDLVKENLGLGYEEFQQAEHDSTEDAKASMKLFQCVMPKWEKSLLSNSHS